MQFEDRIKDIETRAARVNLTLFKLCRRTGVRYSTLHRWMTGKSSPIDKTLKTKLGSLEAELDHIERRLLSDLSSRPAA